MVVICVDGNCFPAAVYFKIRRTTPMRKMMEAYCARCAQTLECCRFEFNGSLILPGQTAENLDMQEGSRLTCVITPDSAETLTSLAKKAKSTRVDNSRLIVENNGSHECMICAYVYWPPVLCACGHTLCQGTAPSLLFLRTQHSSESPPTACSPFTIWNKWRRNYIMNTENGISVFCSFTEGHVLHFRLITNREETAGGFRV